MAKKFIGRFYFKKTSNGNLIGEFSNNEVNRIYTESADIPKGQKSKTLFSGTYTSTWNNDDEPIIATLKIKPKHKSNNTIFSLTWELDRKPIFWGEGMLCDDILIGDYRDFKNT